MTEYCEISGAKIRDPEPLKVGDRVRLIGYSSGGAPVEGQRGTVAFVNGGLIMRVKVDAPVGNGEDVVTVFVSQALKLKPQVQK